MLDLLVEVYPEGITRDELGERAGYSVSGGTFQSYLSSLRRNGLADVDGALVTASPSLFLGRSCQSLQEPVRSPGWPTRLTLVAITHTHADHIGQLDDVLCAAQPA